MMKSSHSNKMSSSGPAPKKLKIADEIESIGKKSLMDMPEEVIERIFTFTELSDQKSLSETCMKLNMIFGRRRILNGARLVVGDHTNNNNKRALSNSTRSYTNVTLYSPISFASWKNLATSLKYLDIFFPSNSRNSSDFLHSIISALPYLAELTRLDYRDNDSRIQETNRQLKAMKTIKPVVLKKLTYLQITCMFMLLLHNRLIQIDSEMLHTIKFKGENHSSGQNNCYDDVRDLIKRQKNLRVLQLRVTGDFFDCPFVINSNLRELHVFRSLSHVPELTHEQEANICDFLISQKQLEVVKTHCVTKTPSARVMKSLSQWVQHLKLKCKSVYIVKDDYPHFELDNVTVEEMQNHQLMSSVEELLVTCFEVSLPAAQIQTLFSQIATKFPNVAKMVIFSRCSTNFALVGSLNNTRELKICLRRDWSFLKLNSLPNLESFTLEFTSNDIPRLNHEKANLIDFLVRHETLKKISLEIMHFGQEIAKKVLIPCLTDILRAVLLRLSNLKMFSVDSEDFFPDFEYWGDDFLSHHEIHTLMIEHARPGFLYSYAGNEVLKRDDNKLVQKEDGPNGRWTEMK